MSVSPAERWPLSESSGMMLRIFSRTKAAEERRIVLTFDLDFGDLLAAGQQSLPSVITFRLHNPTPAAVTPRLLTVLSTCSRELLDGAVVIVEDAEFRVRRLPIRKEER